MITPIYLGIISGILTTILLLIVKNMWSLSLVPSIKKLFNREPDISGNWKTFDENIEGALPVGIALIVQKGENISMTLDRYKKRDVNKPTSRKLFCKGKLLSGILNLIYEEEKMKVLINGTMVLKISTDNKRLTGKVMYYNHKIAQVVSKDLYLIKQ